MPSTPAKPPRLTGEALRAGYASRHVLDGVDLAVAEGKLTVLLGPNGSGKSTLLKTLARTLTPSAGRVCLDGKDIHRRNTREVAQRLGILPQGQPERYWRLLAMVEEMQSQGFGDCSNEYECESVCP